MNLEAGTKWPQRCTKRPYSSERWHANWGHVCANLKTVIECNWRWTWRLQYCQLGGHHQESLQMHSEAEIEWTQWYTWRPRICEFGDAIGGDDWSRYGGAHSSAQSAGSRFRGDTSGGRCDGSYWHSMYWSMRNWGSLESCVHKDLPRNETITGCRKLSIQK